MPSRQIAFSLVELSIVLVILGLLTGGILAGQSLIRAAELRSVSTDYNRYKTAVGTFRDKYFALPGDMASAYKFWGVVLGCTDESSSAVSGTGCNGNGDGRIGGTPPTFVTEFAERFRAWQHLASAGLIEGQYTGVAGPDNAAHAVARTNVPASRISNGAFMIETIGPYTSSSFYKTHNYGNSISVGNPTTLAGVIGVRGALFTSGDAYAIDVKLDDGMPTQGFMIIFGNTDCRDGAGTDPTGPYNLDVNVVSCAIMFLNSF